MLDVIVEGRGFPALQHPSKYARQFNEWCLSRGQLPYFYSATKASVYGIPDSYPRKGEVETVTRLTERCNSIFGTGKPKPFNRVGDNGSVGGQTVMGLIKLRELLEICKTEGIPVKCWHLMDWILVVRSMQVLTCCLSLILRPFDHPVFHILMQTMLLHA